MRVDIDAGVEFVEERNFWRKQCPEKRFEFFLFATREAVVETAVEEGRGNSEFFSIGLNEAARVEGGTFRESETKERKDRNARERGRRLERAENAEPRASVGREREERLFLPETVGFFASDDIGTTEYRAGER